MGHALHPVFSDSAIASQLASLRHGWIGDGHDSDAVGTIAQINPATGQSNGDIDEAGAAMVGRAVIAARKTFAGTWGRMTTKERKHLLRRFAALLAERAQDIAMLETLEVGRPITDAIALIARGADMLMECTEMIDGAQGNLAGADDRRMAVSWQRPRGVVAAITPWNFPALNVLMRLAPALAAGNSVVVKPSEYSPRSAVMIAQLALEAGIPAGVVNVVTGTGAVTGRTLAAHPGVDLITFTGSTATARHVLTAAAGNSLKPVLLECGGKSPQILLDDMFGDKGIWPAIFFACFWNSGQWCVARTRLLVPRNRVQAAVDGLQNAAQAWRLGDPRDATTRLGPLASPQQLQRVQDYLAVAEQGGERIPLDCPKGMIDANGCYVAPHVVIAPDPAARIVQEEVFGPIMTIQPYDDLEHALVLANGVDFGLAATVWTNDARAGYRFARAIDAGLIDVVTGPDMVGELMPGRHYEPRKQSGFGVDGGKAGLLAYTHAQSVTFRY